MKDDEQREAQEGIAVVLWLWLYLKILYRRFIYKRRMGFVMFNTIFTIECCERSSEICHPNSPNFLFKVL